MNGIAIWLICVPNREIVAAVHRRAKFGCRSRPMREPVVAVMGTSLARGHLA